MTVGLLRNLADFVSVLIVATSFALVSYLLPLKARIIARIPLLERDYARRLVETAAILDRQAALPRLNAVVISTTIGARASYFFKTPARTARDLGQLTADRVLAVARVGTGVVGNSVFV